MANTATQQAAIQDVEAQVEHATGGVIQVAHKLDLRSSIFNGASFKIIGTNPSAAISSKSKRQVSQDVNVDGLVEDTLVQMPSIAAVYPNRNHYLQAPKDAGSSIFSAEDVERFLERRQDGGSGANTSSVIYPPEGTPLINPHMLTGVDKLHAEGMGGQGTRIAIIDSGIDPFHPALGGGYGPGFKVEGGYDFVGEDPSGPDNSPITTCSNHGTATSSIAAGLPGESLRWQQRKREGDACEDRG